MQKILKVLKIREEKVRAREILVIQMEEKVEMMVAGTDSDQSERGSAIPVIVMNRTLSR